MIFPNQRASEKYKFALIANDYLDRINTPGDDIPVYQIGAIIELINALYENNLWEKFIAVYPFAGDNSSERNSYNLINSFKYQIQWSGSIIFNSLGITGNGGIGNTKIPLKMLGDFKNLHLSAYVRTAISNTSGNGRLIGVNTTNRLLAIKDIGALELNFNKNTGIVGFVYNILNNSGGFGITYENMVKNNVEGNGFFIANNLGPEIKNAKCYLNGSVFGEQFQLLPTEVHPLNSRELTIFGDGYELSNTTPLKANIGFISIGYGLNENDIYNFSQIVETFQAAMGRSVM